MGAGRSALMAWSTGRAAAGDTAVTRARELLIVVGKEDVVVTMVNNSKRGRRYTGLKLRLQGRAEA